MKSEIFLNFIKSVVVKNGEQINPEIYLAVERDPENLYEIRTDRFKSNSVTLKFFLLPEKELEYSTTSWDQHLTVLNPNHQSNGAVLPPMLKKWANSESGETKIDTRDESFPLFIPATTMSKSE